MKTLKTLIFFSLTILSFQSCSYRWTKVEATNGKKVWIREFKDYKRQEDFEDKYIFKNWERVETYPKYSGHISSDSSKGSTFIQFDSVRVYLFRETEKFKSIFTLGLISGQLLYCKMDKSCRPPEEPKMTDAKTGEPIIRSLLGWTGHTITIDYFKEMKNIKSKPTQRKFKFWVYPYKIRTNGCNDIFLLELTNEKADEKTDIETFIQGATVSLLIRARVMI